MIKYKVTIDPVVFEAEDELDARQKMAFYLEDGIVPGNSRCELLVDEPADKYYIIGWPDIQEYMDEHWFDNEAYPLMEGNSAYAVPVDRVEAKL